MSIQVHYRTEPGTAVMGWLTGKTGLKQDLSLRATTAMLAKRTRHTSTSKPETLV